MQAVKTVISRDDAQSQGRTRYYTGVSCKKRGHFSERFVSSGGCVECVNRKRTTTTGYNVVNIQFIIERGWSADLVPRFRVIMQEWAKNAWASVWEAQQEAKRKDLSDLIWVTERKLSEDDPTDSDYVTDDKRPSMLAFLEERRIELEQMG